MNLKNVIYSTLYTQNFTFLITIAILIQTNCQYFDFSLWLEKDFFQIFFFQKFTKILMK